MNITPATLREQATASSKIAADILHSEGEAGPNVARHLAEAVSHSEDAAFRLELAAQNLEADANDDTSEA